MFLNDWIDTLLFRKKPEELAASGLGGGLKSLAIAGIIFGFFNGIYQLAYFFQASKIMAQSAVTGIYGLFFGPLGFLLSIILAPIFAVIGAVVIGLILHLFCKVLGGKASLGNYIGGLAAVCAAFFGTISVIIIVINTLVTLVAGAIGSVLFSFLFMPIALIVFIWQLAIIVLMTKASQGLSIPRVIMAVVVIPFLLCIVLAVILVVLSFVFFASLLGMLGAGSAFRM